MTAEKLQLAQQSARSPKQTNSNKMKELEKSLKDRQAEIDQLRRQVSESPPLKQSGVNVLDLQRQIERQQVQMQSRQAEVAMLQTAIEAKNQVHTSQQQFYSATLN